MWGRSCREESCIQIIILVELLTEPPWNWASTQSHTTGRETVHTVLRSRADEVWIQGGRALYYSWPSLSKLESCSPSVFFTLRSTRLHSFANTDLRKAANLSLAAATSFLQKREGGLFKSQSWICCCCCCLFLLLVCIVLFVCLLVHLLYKLNPRCKFCNWKKQPVASKSQICSFAAENICGVKVPIFFFCSWKYLCKISVASESQIYTFVIKNICGVKVSNLFFCSWKCLWQQSAKFTFLLQLKISVASKSQIIILFRNWKHLSLRKQESILSRYKS